MNKYFMTNYENKLEEVCYENPREYLENNLTFDDLVAFWNVVTKLIASKAAKTMYDTGNNLLYSSEDKKERKESIIKSLLDLRIDDEIPWFVDFLGEWLYGVMQVKFNQKKKIIPDDLNEFGVSEGLILLLHTETNFRFFEESENEDAKNYRYEVIEYEMRNLPEDYRKLMITRNCYQEPEHYLRLLDTDNLYEFFRIMKMYSINSNIDFEKYDSKIIQKLNDGLFPERNILIEEIMKILNNNEFGQGWLIEGFSYWVWCKLEEQWNIWKEKEKALYE